MYKISKNTYGANVIIHVETRTSFLEDPANTDYQAFLAWKAEGNEPLPADEVGA